MGAYDKAFGGGGRRTRRPTRQERESAEVMAELREKEEGRQSNWSPSGSSAPQVGFVRNEGEGEDHLASFKQGQGDREGHTLITDGNHSEDKDGFNAAHDHYGPESEGGGNFATDRGHYSGPGA